MTKEFDCTKLDLYKDAIDDGFQYYYSEDAGNYPDDFYTITIDKNNENGCYELVDMLGGGAINYHISEENWIRFKAEVKKYFNNSF